MLAQLRLHYGQHSSLWRFLAKSSVFSLYISMLILIKKKCTAKRTFLNWILTFIRSLSFTRLIEMCIMIGKKYIYNVRRETQTGWFTHLKLLFGYKINVLSVVFIDQLCKNYESLAVYRCEATKKPVKLYIFLFLVWNILNFKDVKRIFN
jgi:hypothetical protein